MVDSHRSDDADVSDASSSLAPNSLECAFEDTPISAANFEEVTRVRHLIREEIHRFHAAQAAKDAAV